MKLNVINVLLESKQKADAIRRILAGFLKLEENEPPIDFAVKSVMEADPTNHKEFVLWLVKLVKNEIIGIQSVSYNRSNQIRLPEDASRVRDVLTIFARARLARKLPVERRDITKYNDFYTVEDITDKLVQAGTTHATAAKVREVVGATIVYNTPPYTVYAVPQVTPSHYDVAGKLAKLRTAAVSAGLPEPPLNKALRSFIVNKSLNNQSLVIKAPEEMAAIKAVCDLGMGPPPTKWCTRGEYGNNNHDLENSVAHGYLRQAPIIIIYRNGKPFLQKNKSQVMDINDRHISVPQELSQVVSQAEKQNVLTSERIVALTKNLDPELAEGLYLVATYPQQLNKIYASTLPEGFGIITKSGTRLRYDKMIDNGKYYRLLTRLAKPEVKVRDHGGITKKIRQRAAAGILSVETTLMPGAPQTKEKKTAARAKYHDLKRQVGAWKAFKKNGSWYRHTITTHYKVMTVSKENIEPIGIIIKSISTTRPFHVVRNNFNVIFSSIFLFISINYLPRSTSF